MLIGHGVERRYLISEKVYLAFLVIIIVCKHGAGSVYSHSSLDGGESTEQLSQMLSGNCVLVTRHPWTKADVLILTLRINSGGLVMKRNDHLFALWRF